MTKTWYQVYKYPEVFGFSESNGKIIDHPNWSFVGKSIEYMKNWCIANKAQVCKIAEQILI